MDLEIVELVENQLRDDSSWRHHQMNEKFLKAK